MANSNPINLNNPPWYERFVSKIQTSDGCWHWTASLQSSGYGQFVLDGAPKLAHRISYELFVEPVPPGMVVHHICYERSCVNPDHLRAVTQRENLLDLESTSPARLNHVKTHCPTGHPYTGENLLIDGGKRKCRTCVNARQRARIKQGGSARG